MDDGHETGLVVNCSINGDRKSLFIKRLLPFIVMDWDEFKSLLLLKMLLIAFFYFVGFCHVGN